MVDGEALVMMMAMISSDSPSRQGARAESGVSDPHIRVFGGDGAMGLSLEKL